MSEEPHPDEEDMLVAEGEEEEADAKQEAMDAMAAITNAVPEEEEEDASPKLSKEQRRFFKKERKRLKKEKKKAKKKKAKKENQEKNNAEESQSTDETESNSSDGNEGEAKFSGEEEEEENNKKAESEENPNENADNAEWFDEEANQNNAQFSDDEEANNNNAQFSDEELPAAEIPEADDKEETNDPFASIPRKRKNDDGIPRKRKSPNNASSLIANVTAKAHAKPAAVLQTTEEDEENFRNSDEEEYDDPTDGPNVSLAALKHNIIGRQVKTAQDVEREEDEVNLKAPYTTDAKISHALRKELACAICHECYLNPVTLLCGHSFCKECIQWWVSSNTNNNASCNCPTCRQAIPIRHSSSLGVNTALRACVLALLGNEVQARVQAQRSSRKGENGGAHDGGYEELVDAQADAWKHPGTIAWQCRRSTVLDAEDQRMQLALGIWSDAANNGMNYNPRSQTLSVSLCLLQMEEDEVADGGFPRVVHEDDEEENEQLLVSRSGGRFVHSFVRATAACEGNKQVPLGRGKIQASGTVEMSLELVSPELTGAQYVSFEHEETGAVFDLRVPDGWNGDRPPPKRQKNGRTASSALELDDDDDEHEHDKQGRGHDSEEDGSHMDHFEDDGFLAEEGEEQPEDDLCGICKKGGNLIVCDGGDNLEGCAMSFHIECINRTEVPRGDWVCQDCAKLKNLEVGVEGHEFPMTGTCHLCDKDGVDLECEGGEHVQSCGNRFHLACVERTEYPKGDWVCMGCALQIGKEVGNEGYEFPAEIADKEEHGEDAIEINDSEPDESPLPRKKRNRQINPKDVIALDDDDESEAAEFDSPAKGGRHIGGDSDEEGGGDDDDEEEEEEEVQVRPRAKKPKRMLTLDDDDDDD